MTLWFDVLLQRGISTMSPLTPLYPVLWGNPLAIPCRASVPSKTIWCNDNPLRVSVNLHEALLVRRGLRLDVGSKKLLLWIDAICIYLGKSDQILRESEVQTLHL